MTHVSYVELDGFGSPVNLLTVGDVAVVGPALAAGLPHELGRLLDSWMDDTTEAVIMGCILGSSASGEKATRAGQLITRANRLRNTSTT